ncbi:Flagellar basal body P-ring biosynthesis protein-like protein [Magnetococcus marinus MC-1]|uniref:Flagella basal body P-ring formation protein FlgA n=1 Tax=Magnetococcus marinus (strain ATCC BAA-1437 / JCM 17883 / MC-1) TaxID=156889 RepID=A0LC96_MAGMM|nr:flagellar basal body P-ring formation chaperone FlgA [Magnetococcus marinus]ABK45589.1 Flagellar basal body P-ring biosynthesis protein-like protein [Magnetococcus marinus MC-1]
MKKSIITLITLMVSLLWVSMAGAQVLSRYEMAQEAGVKLQDLLRLHHPSLESHSLYFPRNLQLPEGEVDLQLDTMRLEDRPGRQTVPVTVLVDGTAQAVVDAVVVIRKNVTVAVLKRQLKRDDIVALGDIDWQTIQISREGFRYVSDVREIVGKAASRPVRANIALQASWFEEPVAVERGDRVRVLLKDGALVINTVGVAGKDGRVGEAILVRNLSSNKSFLARVMAPGQVVAEGL